MFKNIAAYSFIYDCKPHTVKSPHAVQASVSPSVIGLPCCGKRIGRALLLECGQLSPFALCPQHVIEHIILRARISVPIEGLGRFWVLGLYLGFKVLGLFRYIYIYVMTPD